MAEVAGIVRGSIVTGTTVAGEVVRVVTEGGNDLSSMNDNFQGAALAAKWTDYEGSGATTIAVANSDLNLTVDAGGVGFAFWFDANLGTLLYQLVTGNFDAVATIRVRNLADSGLPTVGDGNYRIAGLAAHDPNRAALNYEHVGLGCTASAAITTEWKTTVASVSTFGVTAAPTGAGQVRLRRVGQFFYAYYREVSSAAWTLIHTTDRTATPMPTTLQLGFMVYASVASHDIRLFCDDFSVTRP